MLRGKRRRMLGCVAGGGVGGGAGVWRRCGRDGRKEEETDEGGVKANRAPSRSDAQHQRAAARWQGIEPIEWRRGKIDER